MTISPTKAVFTSLTTHAHHDIRTIPGGDLTEHDRSAVVAVGCGRTYSEEVGVYCVDCSSLICVLEDANGVHETHSVAVAEYGDGDTVWNLSIECRGCGVVIEDFEAP